MSWGVQVPFLSENVRNKDTPGHQDKTTAANKGFTSRKELPAQSKSVQMMGKLHLDLFCEEKYLLNHANLIIKLRRSSDEFAIPLHKMNPSVVFPSSVETCFGPAIHYGT
jgi:hypothetical protein